MDKMRDYSVTRQFISPPREGDNPDVRQVRAESAEAACKLAFSQCEKHGTYMPSHR